MLQSSESSSTLREVQHRDFAEYGCALTSLSAESGPRDWKTAIKGAFHEVCTLITQPFRSKNFPI